MLSIDFVCNGHSSTGHVVLPRLIRVDVVAHLPLTTTVVPLLLVLPPLDEPTSPTKEAVVGYQLTLIVGKATPLPMGAGLT